MWSIWSLLAVAVVVLLMAHPAVVVEPEAYLLAFLV
jgi:hypothetical protein